MYKTKSNIKIFDCFMTLKDLKNKLKDIENQIGIKEDDKIIVCIQEHDCSSPSLDVQEGELGEFDYNGKYYQIWTGFLIENESGRKAFCLSADY